MVATGGDVPGTLSLPVHIVGLDELMLLSYSYLERNKAYADQGKHFAPFFKGLHFGEVQIIIERGYRES